MHLTAKFYHPTFNRSEVIVLTNKHTPLKTHLAPLYATRLTRVHMENDREVENVKVNT